MSILSEKVLNIFPAGGNTIRHNEYVHYLFFVCGKFLPQGIICAESALFHYGYNDFSPREWSIAVPRTASRVVKNIVEFPMKAYYIQKDFLTIGKSVDNFNGVTLPVYDRERTLSGGIPAPFGKITICGKSCAERRIVHLFRYRF